MVASASKIIITFYVQPGAKRTEIFGKHGAYIKIRLQAPPVEGKANKALIDFVAGQLKLSPSSVTLIRGHKSRVKTLAVECPPGLNSEACLLASRDDIF